MVTFIAYLSIHFIVGLTFTLFTILYVTNRFRESRYYITQVIVDDYSVHLKYHRFDNAPTSLDIPIKDIKTQWLGSTVANLNADKLLFKEGDEIKLKQYSLADWGIDEIKSVHEYFQDLQKAK